MAKKRYSRRSKKIEPAVMTLNLITPSVAQNSQESFYVDLSQITSLVNRRFYRQGISWAVAGFKVLTAAGLDGSIVTRKLPATWTMSNSWEKGFRTWQKMNDEALEESESVKPRFLDYKIYADARHHNKGFVANLLPTNYTVDAAGTITVSTATPGEWEPSKMQIPTGTAGTQGNVATREIIAVGPNYPGTTGVSGLDAVSLIEGYAASRGLPNIVDPNTPDDAADTDGFNPDNWLAATFNEGTEQNSEVLDDMITENNLAPYPFENDGTATDTMYPGGANQLNGMEVHDISNISVSTIGGITRIKGGMFPCGLIAFDWGPTSTAGNVIIQIDLVPGHHRGYLCEPMTDM